MGELYLSHGLCGIITSELNAPEKLLNGRSGGTVSSSFTAGADLCLLTNFKFYVIFARFETTKRKT